MAKQPDVFRVRLNCIDHYQATPGPLDAPLWGPQTTTSTQRGNLPQVPVIRVFGATETGQKVCAHIHGAFPYLYIPYIDSVKPDEVETHIATLRHSIDHALAMSYRRNLYDNPRNSTFVAHISLVKAVPFFGYNVGYKYYLKIYLLNPLHMTRFADLLQSGAILQRAFQPYEAHQQYLLQWMCDFNLYGCAYIEANRPRWRAPIPSWEELEDIMHLWHDRCIAASNIQDEQQAPRQSHCQLELDFRVEDILNRNTVHARPLHHSFIERLTNLDNVASEEKWVQSMAGLWRDETRRRKLRMGLSAEASSSPFPPEVLVSMSADPRNTEKGGWIHEEEFREIVATLAEQERRARGGGDVSFESFLPREDESGEGDGVQTALESVEELFHERLMMKWRTKPESLSDDVGKDDDQPLVDMNSLAQVEEDEAYGSDEETERTKALTQSMRRLQDAGIDGAIGEAKVNGNAEEIEYAAEHVDANVHVAGHTVEEAQTGALKRKAESSSQGPDRCKRARVPDDSDRPPSRHVAFRVQDIRPSRPPSAAGVLHPALHGRPPAAQPPPSGQAPQPLSSQQSQQSSQGKRLSFPVVKNAHDPETPLRLSQRDDLAHIPHKSSRQEGKSPSKTPSSSHATSKSPGTGKSPTTPATSETAIDQVPPQIDAAFLAQYATTFTPRAAMDVFVFGVRPPSFEEVGATVMPSVLYQDAHYSNEKDVPERPREYAGQEFRLESKTLPFLPEFVREGLRLIIKVPGMDRDKMRLDEQRRRRLCGLKHWEIMQPVPTSDEVEKWLKSECRLAAAADELVELEVDGPPTASQLKRKNRPAPELSQIEGPTQKNRHGSKYSQRKASTSVQHETGYMSTMALEVHVNSRAELAPDPERDEVNMVVWCIADEQMEEDEGRKMGVVVLNRADGPDRPATQLAEKIRRMMGNNVQVDAEDDELDLLNRMVDIVRSYDPDILTGFEVHNSSWGYLIERARLQYEFNLPDEFSRMKSQSHGRFGKDADRWGFTHTSTVRITGRHTVNIWRAMRSELNLLQYTMENVVFHVLHRRIPQYTFATLTRWFTSAKPRDLAKVLDYFVTRTRLDLEILDANELIPRTSEQARLLGVDFFSVFSRGSQFKVESLMFRIAKPESFVLVSPSRKQVGAQNALECLPLVMEPQSAFYSSPLLVLDFQSLYPSVMIAYNYCYSTCLGRIVTWRGTNKLGFADFKRAPGLLELVKDKLNIAPNGMMYVRPEMRKSLLAKMLGEILETRVMVKSGMKVDKEDKTLQQLLNNRQLALKLIANVTYGYTSASFSGRMPCSEIADSIVQTGRETLEKAIALIHSVERWGAEVVYGDTDSLFVYLKGRSRADAFKIGDEIAKAVTETNPRPIKLKFEKVYHPCVLLAKKRYVGFKYESPSQTEPDFDAKGIETVRRDGTPAEQKIEEKALKLLFRTSDLTAVKTYFQNQCYKIMTGRFSVQDFCFAKEVKLGTYADKGPPPPGALIATKRMLRDPRTEPQYGERVPYVVIAGAPGARLFERCVEPERLVHDEHAELDAEYYISKNLIPPLERIFNLVGANVRAWYDEMPKVQRIRLLGGAARDGGSGKEKKSTMESYMGSSLCLVCRMKLPPIDRRAILTAAPLPLCETCRNHRPQKTLLALRAKVQKAELKARSMEDVCRSCANLAPREEVRCDSRDCPVFYSRVKAQTSLRVVENGIGKVLEALEREVTLKDDMGW